jgi:DNA polymerase (family 10)
MKPPDNDEIAGLLERIADLLAVQDANPYRVQAYRNAARTVRECPRPLVEILQQEGTEGLDALPGIGRSLAALVAEYVHSGRSRLLDRLEGQVSPEDLFATVPGIGEELAQRIARELEIETLEDLELAAHDGRLRRVPGFGPRRAQLVREALAGILGRSGRRRARRWHMAQSSPAEPRPPAPEDALLLEIDAEYRRRAAAGELRTIAPRRFNPEGKAWLPILHADRGRWRFTALFSNTARAHELGTSGDWVVIYYECDGDEDQCTVITDRTGQRIVRR